MFVLVLASVNLVSASGNGTADSASKNVSSVFKVNSVKGACVEKSLRGSGFYLLSINPSFYSWSLVIISASGGFRHFLKSCYILS